MRKTLGLMALLLGIGACSPSKQEVPLIQTERLTLEEVMVQPPVEQLNKPKLQFPSFVYLTKPELILNQVPRDNVSKELYPYGTIEGIYQRVRRWHSIFYEVEKQYGIPPGYLAGLSMRESAGDPINLNNGGDGGAGLMMFQPGTARAMGLKVYGTSRATGRDIRHGNQLEILVKRYKHNLAKLSTFDERFNPEAAIPAAGKFLFQLKERYGSWEKAISAYRSGSPMQNLDQDEHVQKTLEFARYYLERNNGIIYPGDFVLVYRSSFGLEGYEYIVQSGDTLSRIRKIFQQKYGCSVVFIRDDKQNFLKKPIYFNQRIYVEINPLSCTKE